MSLWGKAMCQLLNLFSCHPPFLLTHLSLSHQSTTTLKILLISWDSYCWVVPCGRTVSPCPHAHSTSRLIPSRREQGRRMVPLSILPFDLAHPHVDGGFFSRSHLLTHRILHRFPHVESWRNRSRSTTIFLCMFSSWPC